MVSPVNKVLLGHLVIEVALVCPVTKAQLQKEKLEKDRQEILVQLAQ